MKRLSIIILFVVSLILDSVIVYAEDINIPEDAVEFNGHYYKLYVLNMTWEDAKIYCENIGGHLATITTQEENDFLFKYITDLNYDSAYFGASDKEIEGIWEWVTDEKFLYSNWHSGEPNNDLDSEHYVMFYYEFSDGTWNDGGIYCNAKIMDTPYICEWDSTTYSDDEKNNQSQSFNNIKQYENTVETNQYTLQNESSNQNTDDSKDTEYTQNNKIENNESKQKSDNDINITFHIDNLSFIGGLSIFGGISLIGFVIKRNRNKD